MVAFKISGGTRLQGEITINGAKNVALKTLVAALLTDEPIVLRNIPNITDVGYMIDVLNSLGVNAHRYDHTVHIQNGKLKKFIVPLDIGARLRTSSLVVGPLLVRYGKAIIPNPGGCRIGARPIDRYIDGLRLMGATISYDSKDGFFHSHTSGLHGAKVKFQKNTHTGTEGLILAAVLARGRTILENAAQEVEIDDLIQLLNSMGAKIQRKEQRTIIVDGVDKLGGTTFSIMPDRNEEVTYAIAAALTHGSIIIRNSQRKHLRTFIEMFKKAGGQLEIINNSTTRYFRKAVLTSTKITTSPHPGFMTDWQAPWAVLMTQAHGRSTIHETVFESRFTYVLELKKMGAKIEFYEPAMKNPDKIYNFNREDSNSGVFQAIAIDGPVRLHNGILEMNDLRAGASLLLAAFTATGDSYLNNVSQIDRGYEDIDKKFNALGAKIIRI